MGRKKDLKKDLDEDLMDIREPEEGKKETLVDIICRNIRRDIIVGELIPGEKLMAKDLAEKYGTSETPVKLALNRMISEEVVENYPRQGMVIKPMTLSDAEEIFDLRLMMDLYYTKQIIEAVKVNKTLRRELEQNIEEHEEIMRKFLDTNDVELFLQDYNHDYEFHKIYAQETRSWWECTKESNLSSIPIIFSAASPRKKIWRVWRSIKPYLTQSSTGTRSG